MKWERIPLTIPLYVDQERIIFVDNNVRVGLPSSVAGKLRVQSTGGTLYLKALEPIAQTRLQLQDAESGALMLIDIAASLPPENTPALEPIQVIEGDITPIRYGRSEKNKNTDITSQRQSSNKQAQQRETPIPVILTRYAAQNLYAPLRTIEPIVGVTSVNINRDLK